jgi:hypothetical protein
LTRPRASIAGPSPALIFFDILSPQPGDPAAHQAGTAQLEQIIRRGQRTGDFDRTLPAGWLAVAIVGLVRTAAEQVAAGRLTTGQAAALALDSTQRLCGAASARD